MKMETTNLPESFPILDVRSSSAMLTEEHPTQAWDRVSDTKQKANRACLEEMDTWEVEIHTRETNHGKFFIRSCKGSGVTKDTATLFTL